MPHTSARARAPSEGSSESDSREDACAVKIQRAFRQFLVCEVEACRSPIFQCSFYLSEELKASLPDFCLPPLSPSIDFEFKPSFDDIQKYREVFPALSYFVR